MGDAERWMQIMNSNQTPRTSGILNYSSNNPWAGKDENLANEWESFTNRGWRPETASTRRQSNVDQMTSQVRQGSDFSGYQNQLQGLLNNPSSIQNDPSYQFRLNQGNQAINRSAAARGMLGSGNVLAELAKYGQGMASEEYGNQFNRLSDLMKNAQQFGLNAGYYAPQMPTQGQWVGGAYVQPNPMNPSYF